VAEVAVFGFEAEDLGSVGIAIRVRVFGGGNHVGIRIYIYI